MSKDAEIESTSESDSQSGNELTWIQWFCSMRGNEFFCEVDEEFIQDEFNLYGLSQSVPNYDYALDMILDNESDEELTEEQQEVIERNAEVLYGLIHARFITTAHGQQLMLDKVRLTYPLFFDTFPTGFHSHRAKLAQYKQAEFGRCPRVFCNGHAVLPVGLSDLPQQNTVKLFCPRCGDIYFPKYTRHATIDGAYFGTTFPHLLLLQFPEIIPQRPRFSYVPKIFGFKLNGQALVPPAAQQAPSASTAAGPTASPVPGAAASSQTPQHRPSPPPGPTPMSLVPPASRPVPTISPDGGNAADEEGSRPGSAPVAAKTAPRKPPTMPATMTSASHSQPQPPAPKR